MDPQDRLPLLSSTASSHIDAGETALAEAGDGGQALRRYLHAAIDNGLGAVNIVHPLIDEPDRPDRQAAAADMLDRLVRAARHDAAIGPDVTASDIALAAIRFCRPLAIGVDLDDERAIAHHQLDHYLDGLTTSGR